MKSVVGWCEFAFETMAAGVLQSAACALRQAFTSYNQRGLRAAEERGLDTALEHSYSKMGEQLAASLEKMHPLKVCSSRRPLHLAAGMQHNGILHGSFQPGELAAAAVRHRDRYVQLYQRHPSSPTRASLARCPILGSLRSSSFETDRQGECWRDVPKQFAELYTHSAALPSDVAKHEYSWPQLQATTSTLTLTDFHIDNGLDTVLCLIEGENVLIFAAPLSGVTYALRCSAERLPSLHEVAGRWPSVPGARIVLLRPGDAIYMPADTVHAVLSWGKAKLQLSFHLVSSAAALRIRRRA